MSYRSYSHRDEGGRGGGGGGGGGSGLGGGGGSGGGQKETAAEDVPPMSRLFVICNKSNTEEDIRSAFEQFGDIEEVWVVRNKQSGENKGIVYIKFQKTSSAAKALEEMNGKMINNSTRAIKVLVASSRNQGSNRPENEPEKYVRLFVMVPKDMTEEELTVEFEKYGNMVSVSVIKDKVTKERKGFAYIRYQKFSHAAEAFEQCNSKYKAVFAEPKSTSRAASTSERSDRTDGGRPSHGRHHEDTYSAGSSRFDLHTSFSLPVSATSPPSQNQATLNVVCSSSINQDQLWRLFDIIPGLEYCQITGECSRTSNYATAVYNNPEAAAYAREKLHALEYPPGERIIIKPIIDVKPTAESSLFPFEGQTNKELFCSVSLPAPAPMADPSATCVQRCFVVCVPKALPSKMLLNIFSRFGNLIDVYMLQNKNCGYAKYATEASAMAAIDGLHRAEICGVKLKVMEAEEPRDAKRKRYEDE